MISARFRIRCFLPSARIPVRPEAGRRRSRGAVVSPLVTNPRTGVFFPVAGLLVAASLAALTLLAGCDRRLADPSPLFVAYGRVLEVDLEALTARELGALHLTAPDVALDAEGFAWGRIAPVSVGAIDLRTGRSIVPIRLPDAPFLVAHDGERTLYVSHNTVRDGTSRISVVDTRSRTATAGTLEVPGLSTDLCVVGGDLYVAVMAIASGAGPSVLRYRGGAGEPEILWAGASIPSQLRLACTEDALYSVTITGRSHVDPAVRRFDLQGGTVTVVRLDESTPITHVVGRPVPNGSELLIPGLLDDGRSVVAAVDLRTLQPGRYLSVNRPVAAIVAAGARLVATTESLASAGANGLLLTFTDRHTGEEVKRLRILDVIANR